MNDEIIEFKSIECASQELLYKDKGSKFFGYAYPIQNESDVQNCIANSYKLMVTSRTNYLSETYKIENKRNM